MEPPVNPGRLIMYSTYSYGYPLNPARASTRQRLSKSLSLLPKVCGRSQEALAL